MATQNKHKGGVEKDDSSPSGSTDRCIDAELDALRREINELRSEKEELRRELADVHAELDSIRAEQTESRIEWRSNGKQLDSLWIDGVPVGNAIQKRRSEITELESTVDEIQRTDTLTTASELDKRLTLGERALELGTEILSSKSEKRAVSILSNFESWADNTQSGLVIKTRGSHLKSLLEAELDCDLAWKQVYRSCRSLEDLTDGKIEFVEQPDRKMLVLQERLFSMTTE